MPAKKPAKKAPVRKASIGVSFLPTGYELPKPDSQFFTLQDGDNRLRILSPAVVGWEAWFDGVPKRAEGQENPFDPELVDFDEKYQKPNMSHFWAFIIWNADEKKIQLWQVTQRSILTGLWTLIQQEEWGDPRGYGIIVTKTVNKKKTEYKVNGVPHKPLSEEIKKALAASNVRLEKLFEEAVEEEPETVPTVGDDF